MKLNALEKAIFNSAVKRINEQLRVSKLKGWKGLTDEIENFLLPYKTTDKGYLSQSTQYYDKYDINRLMKYSRGEFYISNHKTKLIDNFGDLEEEELKEYSSTLPKYVEKFNDYMTEFYGVMLVEYSDELYEKGTLTYPQIYDMVNYMDTKKHPSNRQITLKE